MNKKLFGTVLGSCLILGSASVEGAKPSGSIKSSTLFSGGRDFDNLKTIYNYIKNSKDGNVFVDKKVQKASTLVNTANFKIAGMTFTDKADFEDFSKNYVQEKVKGKVSKKDFQDAAMKWMTNKGQASVVKSDSIIDLVKKNNDETMKSYKSASNLSTPSILANTQKTDEQKEKNIASLNPVFDKQAKVTYEYCNGNGKFNQDFVNKIDALLNGLNTINQNCIKTLQQYFATKTGQECYEYSLAIYTIQEKGKLAKVFDSTDGTYKAGIDEKYILWLADPSCACKNLDEALNNAEEINACAGNDLNEKYQTWKKNKLATEAESYGFTEETAKQLVDEGTLTKEGLEKIKNSNRGQINEDKIYGTITDANEKINTIKYVATLVIEDNDIANAILKDNTWEYKDGFVATDVLILEKGIGDSSIDWNTFVTNSEAILKGNGANIKDKYEEYIRKTDEQKEKNIASLNPVFDKQSKSTYEYCDKNGKFSQDFVDKINALSNGLNTINQNCIKTLQQYFATKTGQECYEYSLAIYTIQEKGKLAKVFNDTDGTYKAGIDEGYILWCTDRNCACKDLDEALENAVAIGACAGGNLNEKYQTYCEKNKLVTEAKSYGLIEATAKQFVDDGTLTKEGLEKIKNSKRGKIDENTICDKIIADNDKINTIKYVATLVIEDNDIANAILKDNTWEYRDNFAATDVLILKKCIGDSSIDENTFVNNYEAILNANGANIEAKYENYMEEVENKKSEKEKKREIEENKQKAKAIVAEIDPGNEYSIKSDDFVVLIEDKVFGEPTKQLLNNAPDKNSNSEDGKEGFFEKLSDYSGAWLDEFDEAPISEWIELMKNGNNDTKVKVFVFANKIFADYEGNDFSREFKQALKNIATFLSGEDVAGVKLRSDVSFKAQCCIIKCVSLYWISTPERLNSLVKELCENMLLDTKDSKVINLNGVFEVKEGSGYSRVVMVGNSKYKWLNFVRILTAKFNEDEENSGLDCAKISSDFNKLGTEAKQAWLNAIAKANNIPEAK